MLYTHTGPYYVGIARKQHLGKRLADHVADEHAHRWQRFSWFGFLPMTDDQAKISLPDAEGEPSLAEVGRDDVIKDMEALLIKSMGTYNINNMNFSDAKEWVQVDNDEAPAWISWLA